MRESNSTAIEKKPIVAGDRGELADPKTDREFKAYIYQQLVDLQPYLTADSQVSVYVEKDEEENFNLSLVTTWGESKLEVEAKNQNMYEAFSLAKKKFVEQLNELYDSAIDGLERDALIRGMLDGSLLIH